MSRLNDISRTPSPPSHSHVVPYQIEHRLAVFNQLKQNIPEGTFARFNALIQFETQERELLRQSGGIPRSRCLDMVRNLLHRQENQVFGVLNLQLAHLDGLLGQLDILNANQAHVQLSTARNVLGLHLAGMGAHQMRDALREYCADLLVIVNQHPDVHLFEQWQQHLMQIQQELEHLQIERRATITAYPGTLDRIFERINHLNLNDNQHHDNQPR